MRKTTLSGVIAAALVLSACGSRMSHREVVAASATASDRTSVSDGRSTDLTGNRTEGPLNNEGPLNTVVGSSASGAQAGATTGGVLGSRAAGTGPTAVSAVPGSGRAAAATPALLASVGTYAGPIGGAVLPLLQGAQLWVKYINQKGGLNG